MTRVIGSEPAERAKRRRSSKRFCETHTGDFVNSAKHQLLKSKAASVDSHRTHAEQFLLKDGLSLGTKRFRGLFTYVPLSCCPRCESDPADSLTHSCAPSVSSFFKLQLPTPSPFSVNPILSLCVSGASNVPFTDVQTCSEADK